MSLSSLCFLAVSIFSVNCGTVSPGEGAKALSMENAAIDFVHDAFGHLKAIAGDKGGRSLLKIANIGHGAGVVDTNDKDAFIAAAKTRQWDREKSVRTLA
jgi:catalase